MHTNERLVLPKEWFTHTKSLKSFLLISSVNNAALKLTASQRSLSIATAFVTAEKHFWTVTMTANTYM